MSKFNENNIPEFFEGILKKVKERMEETHITMYRLSKLTGYSSSTISMALSNTQYHGIGAARTSKRMDTLIDICRSLGLSIYANTYRQVEDLTEEGYCDLPKALYEFLRNSKMTGRNFSIITGMAPNVLNGILQSKGEINSQYGLITYMRIYHTACHRLTIAIE